MGGMTLCEAYRSWPTCAGLCAMLVCRVVGLPAIQSAYSAGLFFPLCYISSIYRYAVAILSLSPASWLDALARACARRVRLGLRGGSMDGAL